MFVCVCVWVILGVPRWDMKRNTMLWSLGEMERVETTIMKRRLRWLGHLERMENSRIPNASWYAGLSLGGGQLEARRRDGVMCW